MMVLGPGADLFPLLAAIFSAVACGVLGNFLVLRRLSLMGDAISHSVLPGLVIAFIVTSSRSPLAMLLGAGGAGLATVVLVELVKRLGRVEPGAAMGVVFSVLFALGVLLIERAARQTDLDADCVLHGQLETLVWFGAPASWGSVDWLEAARAAPRQVLLMLGAMALSLGFVSALFKELRLAAFDPALASSLGFRAGLLHYALMVVVAVATVAAFEAVGSILVIAMLVCPAGTARLLTDRLRAQVLWSVALALAAATLGYLGSSAVPRAFGKDSVNAAGTIAVTSGLLLVVAILASPSHGIVARWWRQRGLARQIALDDLLGLLHRASESGASSVQASALHESLGRARAGRAFAQGEREGLVLVDAGKVSLTHAGADRGARVIRNHRLWERFLVDHAGLAPDHVHAPAEVLEHAPLHPRLDSSTDPHGRAIPRADAPSDGR